MPNKTLAKNDTNETLDFIQRKVKPGKKITDKETGEKIEVTIEGQKLLVAQLESFREALDKSQVSMIEFGALAAEIERNKSYIQAGFDSAAEFFLIMFPDIALRSLKVLMRLARRWKFESRKEIERLIALGMKKLEFLSYCEDEEINMIKEGAQNYDEGLDHRFLLFGKEFHFYSLCAAKLDDLKAIAQKALAGDTTPGTSSKSDPQAEVQLAFESITAHFWPAFEDLTKVKKFFKKLDPAARREYGRTLRAMSKQMTDAARDIEGKKK